MARKKERIETSGGSELSQDNPFAVLGGVAGDREEAIPAVKPPETGAPDFDGKGRRLEVRRLTKGKGGKTVTEISGFNAGEKERTERMAKVLRKELPSGGTVKGTTIELQGDHCEAVLARLKSWGFKPVRAGG